METSIISYSGENFQQESGAKKTPIFQD